MPVGVIGVDGYTLAFSFYVFEADFPYLVVSPAGVGFSVFSSVEPPLAPYIMYEVGKVTPLFYTKSRYPNLYFVGFCELFEGNLSLQNLMDSRRRRMNFLPSSGFVGNKFLPFYETAFLGSCFRAKSRKVMNIG